jgi:hypothetical protein
MNLGPSAAVAASGRWSLSRADHLTAPLRKCCRAALLIVQVYNGGSNYRRISCRPLLPRRACQCSLRSRGSDVGKDAGR